MNDMALITDTSETETRKRNIAALRAIGIDPYPAEAFVVTHTVRAARLSEYHLIRDDTVIRTSGRLASRRGMGRSVFLDLIDEDERIQLYVPRREADEVSELLAYLDRGDFLGVEGVLFHTNRGELTLRVSRLTVLGKGLRFPPIGKRGAGGDTHQALADPGRLLRDRHIALLTDPGLRHRLVLRDRIIRALRQYFYDNEFTEVETPILSRYYGGAAASPFKTFSNALDEQLYLRVSPECSLKRLLCGGMSRIFEIGKNFRNEGVDRSHSPEFSAVEWYESNSDYRHQMYRFETLVSQLARSVHGSFHVRFRDRTLDFEPPWPRLRVLDAVAEYLRIAANEVTLELMLSCWRDNDIGGHEPTSWGEALMTVFEHFVEATLWGPVFVIDHPIEVSPLTKRHREDPRLVERFEPHIGCMEVGNAYSELNDPVEQRNRLIEQDLARDEPYGIDELFLTALEDGMPQAGGAGLGIDRIVMILTDADRLSDVIALPAG